jgi:uncharacterized protein (TIGR02646 family)
MKQINKLTEPNSLVQHRANQPAYYDGLPLAAKDELRQNLLSEQGHICCYCMKRIPEKVVTDGRISYDMKVEHFQCQYNFPTLQLTYTNLFGACTGNEGKPKNLQTCDTKKGDQALTINPISNAPNCETLFKYNSEGEISSIDNNEEINRQLNEVLNLNMQTLKEGRSQVYLEVQRKIESESRQIANRQLKVRFFEQERNSWLNRNVNKFKPYCMVAVYFLTKKIRQNQNP